MPRIMSIALAAAAASALTYLFDPDRGGSRRARLADQARSRARRAADRTRAKTEYQKGVMKGVAHDLTEPFRSSSEYDDDTLLQKVRSEALGHMDEKRDIEVDIRNGHVTVKGTVEGEESHRRVLDRINAVDGVSAIEDRLEVVVARRESGSERSEQ